MIINGDRISNRIVPQTMRDREQNERGDAEGQSPRRSLFVADHRRAPACGPPLGKVILYEVWGPPFRALHPHCNADPASVLMLETKNTKLQDVACGNCRDPRENGAKGRAYLLQAMYVWPRESISRHRPRYDIVRIVRAEASLFHTGIFP
mgnify:CR=1 FL=1